MFCWDFSSPLSSGLLNYFQKTDPMSSLHPLIILTSFTGPCPTTPHHHTHIHYHLLRNGFIICLACLLYDNRHAEVVLLGLVTTVMCRHVHDRRSKTKQQTLPTITPCHSTCSPHTLRHARTLRHAYYTQTCILNRAVAFTHLNGHSKHPYHT